MRKGRKERKKLFPKPQSARVKTEGGKVPLSEKVYRSRNSLLTSFWVCHSKKRVQREGGKHFCGGEWNLHYGSSHFSSPKKPKKACKKGPRKKDRVAKLIQGRRNQQVSPRC